MAAEFLKEHQYIVDTMSACTHDVSIAVDYQFIRPRLVGLDIFPKISLDRDEGRGRASCDIMINICDSAKRLSKDDFIKFVDVIAEDYPEPAAMIRQKYRQVSGKDLPTNTVEEHMPVMCQQDISDPRNQRRNAWASAEPVHNPRVVPPVASVPDDVYLMNTEPRGLALIINNVNFGYCPKRDGSDIDVDYFTKMFQKLHFKTDIRKDLTADAMVQACMQFAKNRELRNVSALSVVILTHGTSNECYFGTDGYLQDDKPFNYITKEQLAKIFNSRNCNYMKEKPKLFIIQACRGDEENPLQSDSVRQQLNSLQNDAPRSERRQDTTRHLLVSDTPRADTADMCFVHSSSMGYKAYRGPRSGSPFVEEFTKLIQTSSHTDEFLDIIRKMQRLFSEMELLNKMMTLPDFSTQLVKKWYIVPGPH